MSLQLGLTIVLGIIMVVTAILALESKKIITSVIYLSLLSLLAVVGFVLLSAPDVAITEAVIGSGLVTALFIFTLLGANETSMKKKSTLDTLDPHPQTESQLSDLHEEQIPIGGTHR